MVMLLIPDSMDDLLDLQRSQILQSLPQKDCDCKPQTWFVVCVVEELVNNLARNRD